eukprot:1941217-Rhodomonas_salina.1
MAFTSIIIAMLGLVVRRIARRRLHLLRIAGVVDMRWVCIYVCYHGGHADADNLRDYGRRSNLGGRTAGREREERGGRTGKGHNGNAGSDCMPLTRAGWQQFQHFKQRALHCAIFL